MNRNRPYTDRTLSLDRSTGDIDVLLRDYFRSEMPDPWPAAPVPRERGRRVVPLVRPARPWQRARRYMALAAALALFVLGYLGLARVFPDSLPGLQLHGEQMGQTVPTPDFRDDVPPAGQQGNSQSAAPKVYQKELNQTTFMRIEPPTAKKAPPSGN